MGLGYVVLGGGNQPGWGMEHVAHEEELQGLGQFAFKKKVSWKRSFRKGWHPGAPYADTHQKG